MADIILIKTFFIIAAVTFVLMAKKYVDKKIKEYNNQNNK